MTDRIRSQHGNVIAADFKPRSSLEIKLSFKSETLYQDDAVMLTRTTALIDGKPLAVMHFVGDFATGHIVQL